MRQGGDTREPLQKIQGDTFAFEQRARGTNYVRDANALIDAVAIAMSNLKVFHAAANFINDGEKVDAGEDQRFTREEEAGGAAAHRNAGLRSDISQTDILGESALHSVDDFRMHSKPASILASCVSYSTSLVRMESTTFAWAPCRGRHRRSASWRLELAMFLMELIASPFRGVCAGLRAGRWERRGERSKPVVERTAPVLGTSPCVKVTPQKAPHQLGFNTDGDAAGGAGASDRG